jgi:hypothetical protein
VSLRRVWGRPAFVALWAGQVVSIAGDRLNYLALVGLVSVHAAGHGGGAPAELAALAWAMLGPALVCSPWAGAIVDRLPLVRVLLWTDVTRALVVAAIPAAYSTGSTMAVFALVAASFTLNCFFLPARAALPPHLVPEGSLTAANALLVLGSVFATVVASALGGRLVDAYGAATALYLDAATYGASVLALALILRTAGEVRPVARTDGRTAIRRVLGDAQSGWRSLLALGEIRRPVVAWIATWIGGGVLHVAGTAHVQRGRSEVGPVGLLLAALALGAIVGTAVALGLERRFQAGRVLRARELGVGLLGTALGLTAFACARGQTGFGLAAFVTGCFAAPVFFVSETALQEALPHGERARVFSVRDFLARGAFLIAAGLAVPGVSLWGTSGTLLAGASALVLAGAICLLPRQNNGSPGPMTRASALRNAASDPSAPGPT